jgi:hypothetical protein
VLPTDLGQQGGQVRFAVIPTTGRPCLKPCVEAIAPQVDRTILIYTIPWHVDQVRDFFDMNGILFMRDVRGPNISRWWNMGLNVAHGIADIKEQEHYEVAVLNDDVIVPAGWFDAVSAGLRTHGAAAACSGGPYANHIVHQVAGPVHLETRMQGFAFMLAGEKGIRADERFRWYYSDDYVDWIARTMGGMVMVPGFHVDHLFPNQQMTSELQLFCAEDAQKFKDMWDVMPW